MQNINKKEEKITNVLKKIMDSIEESKKEIFEISEASRNEYNNLRKELVEFQKKVKILIKEVEVLEYQEKISRKVLLNVSKNFSSHAEDDIKKAYENASKLQVKLVLKKQEEKELIKRRTDLELRLKNTHDILLKSENLILKVSSAFDFLSNDLENISDKYEDMSQKSILGKRIIQAQEEERQRIARDIHDGPAQNLTNAVIKTEVCQKLLDIDITKAKFEIEELKKILRSSIKDIRGTIYNLHPMALDDIGLIPTIKRYISNFENNTNIKVDFVVLSKIEIEDRIKNITLFRIIQESLNNIEKHSCASLVKIKLEITKRKISLLVDDNGKGFDIAQTEAEDKSLSGFGLLNMRERVELLNGTFEIKSIKNRGTKITVNLLNNN